MRKHSEITEKELALFPGYLRREEREASTIEAYLRAARKFAAWLDGRAVTKELAAEWKAHLLEQGYRPVSVNAMLAAVNKLFVCMGREDYKVRYRNVLTPFPFRINPQQPRMFLDKESDAR